MSKKSNRKGEIMMQVSGLERMQLLVAEKQRTGQVTATAERLVKMGDGGVETLAPLPGYRAGQRILQGPLEQLEKLGKITTREFEGGDRYRADAYLSAIDPGTGSVDWARAGGGGRSSFVPAEYSSQAVFDARQRWRAMERDIGGIVWVVATLGLIREKSLTEIGEAVFGCTNERDARNCGLGAFRVCLGSLSNFYGC